MLAKSMMFMIGVCCLISPSNSADNKKVSVDLITTDVMNGDGYNIGIRMQGSVTLLTPPGPNYQWYISVEGHPSWADDPTFEYQLWSQSWDQAGVFYWMQWCFAGVEMMNGWVRSDWPPGSYIFRIKLTLRSGVLVWAEVYSEWFTVDVYPE